ncbi:hypothetical protein B9479_008116 [Cryptococcus floricola]|uniref:RNA-directed DNA polymerase n=1 Tax=Cryptococcus floricola TaxID=2591691 RepID=A0A5D3ALR2_9TREE|nr:hypothetical protein B9479_008116 [Cryptococcus floricola]
MSAVSAVPADPVSGLWEFDQHHSTDQPGIHSGSPTPVTTGSMPTNIGHSSVPVTGPISGNPANTHSGPPAAPASGHTPENAAESSVPAPGSTSSSAASHRTVLAHPHTPATPAAPSLNPTTTHPSMTADEGTDLTLAALVPIPQSVSGSNESHTSYITPTKIPHPADLLTPHHDDDAHGITTPPLRPLPKMPHHKEEDDHIFPTLPVYDPMAAFRGEIQAELSTLRQDFHEAISASESRMYRRLEIANNGIEHMLETIHSQLSQQESTNLGIAHMFETINSRLQHLSLPQTDTSLAVPQSPTEPLTTSIPPLQQPPFVTPPVTTTTTTPSSSFRPKLDLKLENLPKFDGTGDLDDWLDNLETFMSIGNFPSHQLIPFVPFRHILDLLSGFPEHIQERLRHGIDISITTMPSLHCHIIDLEPSIKHELDLNYKVNQLARSSNGNKGTSQDKYQSRPANPSLHRPSDSSTPALGNTQLPRTPCTCGTMHWRKDCPSKKEQPPSFTPALGANNTFSTQPNQWHNKGGAPQRKTGFVDTPTPTSPVPSILNLNVTPIYTLARLNSETTSVLQHQVCINSGAAISLIEARYVAKHWPELTPKSCSPIILDGIGSCTSDSYVETTISFHTKAGVTLTFPLTLCLAERLSVKILIGVDQLNHMGAIIDFKEQLGFNRTVFDNPLPAAKVSQDTTIQPGHEARLEITLTNGPSTKHYLLEPVRTRQSTTRVARSIANVSAPIHFALIANNGENPITLKAGMVIGRPKPLRVIPSATIQHAEVSHLNDEIFPIDELDLNPELDDHQTSQLRAFLMKNKHSFGYGSLPLGHTTLATMTLETGDAKPISSAPYRASPQGRAIIDETIAELLEAGIIEESSSPWASPVILKYFSTFDANKGFHQIPLDPNQKHKSAFRTHHGLHQYKFKPFGFRNGPAIFQRFMDSVLGHYKWQCALVYIDDIIIYSNDFDTHLRDLDNILTLTHFSGITLSTSKSHIAFQSIEALGHHISHLGIGTLEQNIRPIQEFPAPINVQTLMRFLGMCGYYRKFVQGFAQIAEPLNKLLVKNTQWIWSPSCQQAFENLRDHLCPAPILAHPNYSKPFIPSTDASTIGLVYLLRSLQGAEKRYTATELECLAIVWALSKLRGYVEGATLEIITDHSALQWILSFKGTNSCLLR